MQQLVRASRAAAGAKSTFGRSHTLDFLRGLAIAGDDHQEGDADGGEVPQAGQIVLAVGIDHGARRREVLATEGGHSSFAPRDELEIGILRFLLRRYEHVSWERVVSGDGLVNIAEAIAHAGGVAGR